MSAAESIPPRPPRGPSSWQRRDAEGWSTFMPLENARCPAVDRRYEARGLPDRRKKPRPCDRSFILASPGTVVRVRVALSGAAGTTWVTPGGMVTCMKCGVNLEVQVLPAVLLLPALQQDPRLAPLLAQLAQPLPPSLLVSGLPGGPAPQNPRQPGP